MYKCVLFVITFTNLDGRRYKKDVDIPVCDVSSLGSIASQGLIEHRAQVSPLISVEISYQMDLRIWHPNPLFGDQDNGECDACLLKVAKGSLTGTVF
jgi:hypothetical protein